MLARSSFIVGGPSRNGKTTLISVVNEGNSPIKGLPCEALFDVFYDRWYPFLNFQKKSALKSWLCQRRYTNEQRTEKIRPLDFFDSSSDVICQNLPKSTNVLQLVSHALDIYAREKLGNAWIVCDLHPEKYYELFKEIIPGLNLVVVLRDPVEAICANIYFRSYPNRNDNWIDTLEYRLAVWAFSAESYIFWKNKYPENCFFLYFNELLLPESGSSKLMSDLFQTTSSSYANFFRNITPFFSFDSYTSMHFAPDGKWKKLLDNDEIASIRHYTNPLLKKLGVNTAATATDFKDITSPDFRRFIEQVSSLASKSPASAKEFIELSMPFGRDAYLSKQKSRMKTDMKRFLRTLLRMD